MSRLDLYRLYLRLPAIRGKSRLEGVLRRWLFPRQEMQLSQSIRMALDPFEWTQRDLIAHGGLEPLTTALFNRLLEPGAVYVDIGCHVGYHTLVARTLVGSAGKVVAVDPQPYNCERVLANWRANGFDNLVVYVAALGREDDIVSLPDQPPSDKARLSLLDNMELDSARRFAVPVYRLDTVLQRERVSSIKLLKIDTEGYEYDVLIGGQSSLSITENIVLEILPQNQKTGEMSAALLVESGMALFTVDGKAWSTGQALPENNLWARR